jgi:hypothetical protein
MSCQDPSLHSYSSLSDTENATPSGRKRESSWSGDRGHPWGYRSGSRSGSGGGHCAGSACGRSRWSCGAWPSQPSCLFEEKKIHVSQCSQLGCPYTKRWPYSYHQRSREGYLRTLAGLGSRVATVGASRLLDVERPLACKVADITG